MSNENGNGNGSGGLRDSDELDAGPDDPTVVIAPDEFLVGALERLSRGMRGAADRCDGIREMVPQAAARPGLLRLLIDEFIEDVREVEILAGGAARGGGRLRDYLVKQGG